MGSAVARGFGRARAGACLAAAPAASSRAVAGPKPGPGRRGGRLDILAALLRGARAAAFALAALALGVPGEAEAQDVLFVSNLDQDDDTNTDDARDRAQRFTTGSNPAGYTLTSVEIRSEDPQSDDATVSICMIDGRGYPTSSCTPLTVPSSFAAGILVFSAPNDHSLSANTSYTLVVGSPGGESLRLDATRADEEDSAEVAGWSIADAYHTDNTSGWGITGSGRSLRIAVKGSVKIASNAATGIVHPRVLMDTQITVGGYRTSGDDSDAGVVDFWGYAAGRIKVGSNTPGVEETVHDGSLDDTGFAYGGVEYTVSQFTITSDTVALTTRAEARIEIVDAQGTALPDTAAVGIELQGSPTGETVLIDWRQRTARDAQVRGLLGAWRNAPGTVLPVRILNLHASDVWSADLQYGAEASMTVGYGGPAALGMLTATGFSLDGVEYTVDRLTVVRTATMTSVLRFATTPDLPATARLRLAVPRLHNSPGLNLYLALEPASLVSGGPDVDYEWPWSGSGPADLADQTAPVYLTRAPGRTRDVSGFWEATLTPNERSPVGGDADLVGYRGAGLIIPDFPHEPAGAGTLAPVSVSLRGVDYTVEVLAVVANTDDWRHVSLRTDPLLPRGQDLWLELGHVDGSTAVFAIDTASVEAPGYLWRDVYAGEDLHGWGTDSAYNDTAIDSVTVRLQGPAAPIAATVSPSSVREDAGTASLEVTVGLVGGEPALGDVPVTVTVGNADDTATAPDDYAVVAPLTLTISAGQASASQSVTIDVVADSVLEAPERVTFAVAAPGNPSGAPGELSIEDPVRVEFEYWRGTLSRAAPFEVGKWTLSGYFAPLDAARGSTLTPSRLLCCGGREATPSMRSVRVLGRAEGANGRGMFVLAMNGLVRDGALAPAFAGAALRIDGRVRLLDDAELIDFAGAPALAWPWREAGLPDPAAAAFEVRLTGPDHPVLVAVEVVSSPLDRSYDPPILFYRFGFNLEIALRFDEPVTVTGAPTLALEVGANTRQATYAYAPGPRTLVFAYTVVAGDSDLNGIDVGRVADALTLGADASIVSVRNGLDAAYGDLDPEPFDEHKVGSTGSLQSTSLSVRDATVGEAHGTLTMTVVLNFATDVDVEVDWETSDGTATAGSDYATASGTLTVEANDRVATFTVDVMNDTAAEGTETFAVTLSNGMTANNDSVPLDKATATVTILDDDVPDAMVGVTAPAGSAPYRFERELEDASWTVSAAAAPSKDLVVNVLVAESGGDFVPESKQGVRQVTIPAGSTRVTLAPVADDGADEPHGTVTVRVLPGTGYVVDSAASAAAVTVRDDDFATAPLEFALSPASGTVLEGGALAMEQVVRTVADGTFTATGDLARAIPGFEAARLRWGAVTHLETQAADIGVTPSEASLAAADFVPDGGVALVARRSLGSVTGADDGVDEDAERVLVALERTGGGATLLRAAEHPGAAGFDQALADGAFYRAALTVRDQALMLVPETTGLDEGQSMTVRATMMPPRAAAFAVTLSLDSTARLDFVGTNQTLSFAPGATDSTGTVTLRAKRTAPGDGAASVVLTGTPDATVVSPASTTLRVHDGGATAGGAILWETELTVGAYTTDGTGDGRYGYADTAADAVTGLTESTAGALDDATFEFQGVEYTVRRLTLSTSGLATIADMKGVFVATDAAGLPLPVGRPDIPLGALDALVAMPVKLGLEVEGRDGVTRMRPLELETDRIGILAEAAWESLDAGTDKVTVRLIDMGPMVWWNGRMNQATTGTSNGYWVDSGTPNGGLAPDAFELENAAGERVRYTVDRLTVATAGGGRVLRFSTTPDVPADIASLLVSRQDWQSYNPAPARPSGADPESPHPPGPDDLYHVFALTAAAGSMEAAADYTFTLAEDTTAVSSEALHKGIARAMLVPGAGAGSAAPPPPAIEEIWRADVTVGELCARPGPTDAAPCAESFVGAGNGDSNGQQLERFPAVRFGDVSDWRLPLKNRTVFTALRFERHADGRNDLLLLPSTLRVERATKFEGNYGLGFEVQGDYGARMHWFAHTAGLAGELNSIGWVNVDPAHGWEAGEVHRVRVVRPRHGASALVVRNAEARVAPDGATVRLSARVGYWDVLPRGVDTAVRVTANGVSEDITILAGAMYAPVEMTVPMPDSHVALEVGVGPTDPSLAGAFLGATRPIFAGDNVNVPFTFPPEDPDAIEYWSATLRAAQAIVTTDSGSQTSKFGGFVESSRTRESKGLGALVPRRFACCGAPVDSVAGRTVWGLGADDGADFLPDGSVADQLLLGLDGIDLSGGVPDDLRGTTLRLEQIRYDPRPPLGHLVEPLLRVALPVDAATPARLELPDPETGFYLAWPQLNFSDDSYAGTYRVRLTGPDRAVLTAVDTVSSPAAGTETAPVYGVGETIAIRLRFDEPVTAVGAPTLTFGLGSADRTAAYAYGSDTAELVFEYEVQTTDSDTDGIDVAAFPDALTFGDDGAIVSVRKNLDAVYAAYDPPAWLDVKVDGGMSGTDPAGVSLRGATVREGDGAAPLTVVLDARTRVARVFAYETADGDALAGSDYRHSSGTVTVPVGRRIASFEVPLIDDAELEPAEEFTVRLTRSGTTLAEATVTVRDDDMPAVTLEPPTLAAGGGHLFEHETGAPTAWTLRRPEAAVGDALTVNVDVSERGGDFVPAGGAGLRTVTFEANASTVAFTPVVDDATDEAHGTVTVRLRPGTGYVLGSLDALESTVAVRDDDGPAVALRFEPAELAVAEGGTARVFVVAEALPDRFGGVVGTLTEPRDVERVLGPHYSLGYVPVIVTTANVTTGSADLDHIDDAVPIESIRLDGFRATPEGGLILHRAAPPIETTVDTETDDGETFEVQFHAFQGLSDADGRVVLGDPAVSTVTIREGATVTLAFSATDDTIAEGDDAASAGSTTVTATASMARTTAWTVEISAQSADDARWQFVDANRTLTFESNQTTSTGAVTIRAVPNDLDEPDLEVTVRGTPEASTGLPSASAVLTLTDDDLPQVSIAAPEIARETGHLFESEATKNKWVLTRVLASDEALTVNLSVSETDGDVVEADKESTMQAVEFAAGKATTSYTPITVDDIDEVHGNVTVTVESGTGYEVAPDGASASALVRDDDGALVSFAITPAALSVSEGQTRTLSIVSQTVRDMTFTSVRDLLRVFPGAPATALVSVAVTTTGSTDDYAVPADSVLFEFGNYMDDGLGGLRATVPLSFEAREDTEDDAGETVTVAIDLHAKADADRVVLGTPTASVVTLREGPVLTLSVTPADLEIAEGATATVTASVDPVHDAAFTVTVAGMSDDDARWEFVGGTTLTFEASQAAATGSVSIRAIPNAVDDGDLDITLTGTSSVTEVAPPAPVVLTVLDDDLPRVSIAAPTDAQNTGHVFEHEAADTTDANWVWTLTRVGLTDGPLTVNLSVDDTGTFTDGAAATATFGAGASTVRYTPVANDTADEGHGTVTVTVAPVADLYAVVPGSASAMAAVRDDDGPLLEVSIDAAVTAPEGMAAVFGAKAENSDGTLTLAGDLARLFSGLTAVTVNAQSADGSAMAASDYTAFDGSVALDAFEVTALGGRWSGNVSVQTTEDMVTEGSQDFTVTLSLPATTDARIALKSDGETGTATIVEGPALTLSVAPEELAEGATATVTASVEPTHDAAFTVTVAGTPVDDDRWEFVGGTTLTFEASQAAPTGSVTIRAILNDVDEVDLAITLTGTPSVAAVAAPADVVLTVLDDDLPTVSIAAPTGATDDFLYEFEAAQAELQYRWVLTRAGLTAETLTVNLSVSETDGDFVDAAKESATQTVMFAAGDSTTSYTPITTDDLDGDHGTVTVTVQSLTDSYEAVSGSGAAATLAVRDDDGEVLTVSIDDIPTVPEGTAAVFNAEAANTDGTLTKEGHLARLFSGLTAVSVTASTADGSATAGSDYTALSAAALSLDTFEMVSDGVRWVGEVSVDTVDDTDPEGREDFTVTLSLAPGTDSRIALDADNSSAVATIVEGPSVTLTLSDEEIREGGTATVMVTAAVDPVHDMPFTVTLATDSDRIAFPDGATFNFLASTASASETLTVEAVDNEIDDGDVTIELTATPSDAAVTAPAVELTVVDDDDPTVSIAAPTGAMDDFLYEAEAAVDAPEYQWSLTRVGLTDEELIVDVSVADTSTFAAATAATVTFEAGESTAAYTPITADDLDEEHGTVTVTVDSGMGYAVDPEAASAALDVRDDDGDLVTVTLDPATPTVNEGQPAQLHAAAATETDTFDTAAHMARLFGTVTQAEAIASTEASTGTGAATAGTDYTALAATTVALPFADFAAGDRDGVLRLRVALPAIATAEDEVTDPGETFEVKLAAPAGQDARIAVSTTAATVTINEGAIRLCSGIAASTCTDINEALATRNTEGRVEVFNDGEWGTVCDDYWSNGDGNVACTQMGYPGAERVFWSSHFGGAVKGTRTWLDNLQCAGDEDDLFDCPRLGGPAVGDHNCNGGGRHVEDAGVRCLAANTAAMGAPTITGTAQVGETLTAATTGITDADGLTSVTYTYQWIRANGTEADIASANSSTYILIAADLGKTIKVEVSFTDDASNAETLTSAATATVVAAPTAPMVTDVDVTSMPASDDTYGTGEMIRYTVTFDQAVTVVGAPEFEFCLGSSGAGSCEVGMPPPTRRRAPLSSGSGTTMLVFSYTVVEGDMDDNGIWAGDQDRTIKLEGGTIQGTVGGLDAVLTHTVVGTEADHKVNGAAANTAPTAANNTVTTGVGAAYTFEADDFGFADADAGAALASVKIVTVPAAGALALDGTAVLANAVVTKAQIDGDMLTFTPVAGASGTGYASFTFKVNDGTDDSTSAYTMTIDVAASPTVSIAAPAGATDGFLYEFEAATEDLQYRWSLTRVGLTDAALTVDVSVAETGGGDFAADGADTVTFAADESAASYTPITADTDDEEHGTVTVTVTDGTDYDVDPGAASAEVDVRDDDGELVTVTLDPATLTVKEGRQAQLHAEAVTQAGTFDTAAHMARLFGTVTQAEAIASTEASTGTGAATAGTDYTALAAETVALPFADFAAGSGGVLRSRVALSAIATAEDEVTDPGETFKVKLAAPTDQDARIAVSTTAATVTINEGPPGGAIRLCSGTAASTCTDVSEALATRNTQGRVEVINDGVWGTVCDDYWSNDDGQVACTQMGFAGAERVFWNSHFGGAAKGTRTWLDNLRCVGDEKDLFDCPRRGGPAVGDHNCNAGGRHVEDAGVRCLAAETAAHGAKVDPLTLTIAPGRTGRYWVSLTKDPEAEVLVYPKLNTEAMAAPEVTEGPLRFPKDQWSYALDVDVTVNAGTALGTYTVTHTMVARKNPVEKSNVTFTVPAVTVKVAASTSVTGPAPVSATVSGRDASVRFDAPLDASFAPSAADFAVLADGRRLALTGAWTAGRALLLELAEPATGAVRLAYVPSAAAPLGGRDGSAVAPFETLALAAPGELADDAPDTLTADAEPKLEGAPGLEAALADALRHAPGPVAATLAAPRRAVADLTGLGAVPQLRRVNLAGNAVTDAGPLALLGDLERLDLSDNAVEDLWPLSGLAELRVLDLSGNRVTDVTALAGLPRLRALELSGNAVVDLSPLGALPALEYLGLSGNRVTDVTALADLHALTRLDLGGNAVADAAPLGDVGRLVWLRLSGNRLATLDGLGRLTKLRWVWVADNPLPDGATVVWPERAWVDMAADGR